MRVAVIGAGGWIGRSVADLLEGQGHEVRRGALDGAEVVLHAPVLRRADVIALAPVLRRTGGPGASSADDTQRLLETAGDARHVSVSLVGLERVAAANRYAAARLTQERAILASGRDVSIVRITALHEWVGPVALRLARARVELRSRAPVAPISVHEAAAVIARVITSAPSGTTRTVQGPETLILTRLRAGRGIPVPLPVGPELRAVLESGALVSDSPDVRGVLSYSQWLAEHRGRPWRPAPGRR